jgi:hypothetical protein
VTQLYAHKNAFNGGVLSPTVLGRSDLPVYQAGLKRCQNFLITRPGGLERRPGTIYVAATKTPSEQVRLFTFRFSSTQVFVISLTTTHLRVYTNDAVVNYATHRVAAGSDVDAQTDQLHIPSHGYSDGLQVTVAPTVGSTLPTGLAEGVTYTVALPPTFTPNATTDVNTGTNEVAIVPAGLVPVRDGLGEEAVDRMGPYHVSSSGNMPTTWQVSTDYYLKDITEDPADGDMGLSTTPGGAKVSLTATGSGGLTIAPTLPYLRDYFRLRAPGGRIVDITGIGDGTFDIAPLTATPFEIPSPYAESDLRQIQFAQDKDVMYMTHPDYEPRRLIRYADWAWELSTAEFEDGPYLEVGEVYPGDSPKNLTLQSVAATGSSIQLNASQAIFKGSDVGRVVRMGNDDLQDEWGWGRIVGVAGVLWTDPDWNSDTSSARATTTLTMVGHPFTTGEGPVRIPIADDGNMGLNTGTDYYIRAIDVDTISVHTSEADAINDVGREPLAAHVATEFVSSWLNIPMHGFADGDGPVSLSTSGTLTTGLSAGTDYYIITKDVDNIQLSLTLGGAPIAIADDDGTGQHTINGGSALNASCLVDIQENVHGNGFPSTTAEETWRLGAFGSDSRLGYPSAVTLFEQRLIVAGAPGTPQTVYASQAQAQLLFAPDEDDPDTADNARILTSASAYTFRLNSEDLNTIHWLRPVRILFAAGLGGIHHLSGATIAEAITPVNVNAKRGTPIGAAAVSPLTFDTSVVYVEESKKTLQRAEFRPDLEAIETTNLMGLADHLVTGTESIVELSRVQNPLPLVWVLRSDGRLMSLTLDAQQRVAAWTDSYPIGGTNTSVESITSLPDTEEGEIWMVVKRDVDGATVRHIERLANRFDETDDQSLYQAFDGGPIPYDGAPVPAGTPFTGVEHLAGETVQVLADGGVHPDVTISATGTFTLDRDATKVVVGYAFVAEAEGLPPVLPPSQSVQDLSNRPVRVVDMLVRLNRSGAFKVGRTTDDLFLVEFRDTLDLMDTAVPLFTGVRRVNINGTYDEDDAWVIRADQPVPVQILSVTPRLDFPNI